MKKWFAALLIVLACAIAAPIAWGQQQVTGTFTLQRFADYINSLGTSASLRD